MSKKNFLADTMKTMSSTLLIAFSLQLIVYPFINHIVGNQVFGEILTVYTILTIASVVLGNTLNNIRLINVKHFAPEFYYKKFLSILVMSLVLESFILILIFEFAFHSSIGELFWLIILNILMCLRIYLNAFFRMTLKYNQILWIAIVQIISMMLGLGVFKFINQWLVVFIISELFAVVYTLFLLRHLTKGSESEPKKNILKDYVMLFSTNGLNNLNLYLDRLILLPIIGGTAVTISFLATFIGKMLATFLYPINNVILSYISIYESNNIKKQYLTTNIYSFISVILVMIICYPLTIFVVLLFYHIDTASYSKFIIIGNLGVLFNAISIMIQTLNTKHSSITRQANFITLHTVAYIVVTIMVTTAFGLEGFFWATLIANVIKYIALNVIGLKTIKVNVRE
ncbi:polysaccharide biosynthesis protein [Staphylococcus durrellii]|uniref:capsular biosynthesis protein n=1 Tax=Staphylococcus durrellii TaxID=2781773 RepID=UPI0018A044FC|nr:capsular biosynthesis protein [Staphylococcus durrellii]MBF7017997.1 capsular biosynthesis protein [Staphylococcus durrellii]